MNNEEAIKILEDASQIDFCGKHIVKSFEKGFPEAYKMAIEALKKMDLISFNVYALNNLLKEEDTNDSI